MDRRSFINKLGLGAVTSISGLAVHDNFKEVHHDWANMVADTLDRLQEKTDELSQAMRSTANYVDSAVTSMATNIMSDYSKRFMKFERRLTRIGMRQAFVVCWLMALSVITGVDFLTPILFDEMI